jgi:quinoprotein glucose dehydrogenase
MRSTIALVVSLCALSITLRAADPPKTSDAEKALRQFELAPGLTGRVWASEPLLANPVCFTFDEKGNCYVAETYRLHHGVTDNRRHMYWLDDDVACRTVEDRVAMYHKYAMDKFAETYEKDADRVKMVWDSTGRGVADKSSVFSDGYRAAAQGIGAGLLARKGNVYYTNIPDLWLLKDTKGEHKADVQESLARGFGVHVAFLGHDLHGLTMGPDGRLYFTCGDRGLNVTTKEGKHLFNPDSGAVLRCEPDGTNLEIVHRGLRNPQELAWDNYGNLFTVDNNSDSGDKARLVQIVEGGDSGWRMYYQYGSRMSDRGPFNAEKIWHLPPDNTAAYIVPPLAHLTDGPSGLCFNPGGAALPEKYADHFFVCDFRGGADNSGVWAFTVKPKGASFELGKKEHFVWRILATDCDFGPDGGFYVSDWVQGWDQPEKGRLYRFADPEAEKRPEVAQVKKVLSEGFDKLSIGELALLLTHADRRVRQEAQFALAGRGPKSLRHLKSVANTQAQSPEERIARFHAIWALGQLGRAGVEVADVLRTAAGDHDSEIRAQSVRVIGDLGGDFGSIVPALKDAEPRVRFFAALALARSMEVRPVRANTRDPVPHMRAAVIDMLRDNDDQDPYLRHAGVAALALLRPEELGDVSEQSFAVRLAVTLALRRVDLSNEHVVTELVRRVYDVEPRVGLEAIRAIHDLPATPERVKLYGTVALMTRNPKLPESWLYRALNSHFRLGKKENAEAVAEFAASPQAAEKLRIEAVAMLGDWAKPAGRDRILNDWRPLPERDPAIATNAFRARLGSIFAGSDKLRKEAARVAAKLGIKEVAVTLRDMVVDHSQSVPARVEALKALDALRDTELDKLLPIALKSDAPAVRAQALVMSATKHPGDAVAQLKSVLDSGDVIEQQAALATLAELKRPDADALLVDWLDRLIAGKVKPELRLDVRMAASARNTPPMAKKIVELVDSRPKNDPLANFREALAGGDAERGRDIFLNKPEVTCVKCHKLQGVGGEVGPELAGIGGKQKREYLLESIVLPDKDIAKGFDSVILDLKNGKSVTGVLKGEDATTIKIITAEAQLLTIAKSDVDERRRGKSAMPDDIVRKLTLRELRDLVEFLAGLK